MSMTILEFQQMYCRMCGTQRCYGEAEDIAHCGHYNGEIEGIPKVKSLMEMLEASMKAKGLTWDDLRQQLKGE